MKISTQFKKKVVFKKDVVTIFPRVVTNVLLVFYLWQAEASVAAVALKNPLREVEQN